MLYTQQQQSGQQVDFYTIDYVISQRSTDSAVHTALVLVLIIAGGVLSILYMHDKMRTRWRDAGIGAFVLSLVLLGIQAEQYLKVSRQMSQSQLLESFVEGVAIDQHVPTNEVLVNSLSLKDGTIVRFNEEDYIVHLNDDNNSYMLERTHIIDHNVYVNGKH